MTGQSRNIRFLLGGELCEVSDFDPNRTLLDYLRMDARRTGTKEGCGEGDCGACTVVIGTLNAGKIIYEAVNSCILFLPTLDGKLVLTVEDITQQGGSLHPVQQAMANLHGSQCGFCTPGFVMSIFAHIRSAGSDELNSINDALAGNLCRCTGYGPIIDAARQAIAETADDHLSVQEKNWIEQLQDMAAGGNLELAWTCPYTNQQRAYHAPNAIDALAELYAMYPDATLLSGGTDVGLWVTKQLKILERIIYLGQVAELAHIAVTDSYVEIGAGVTYSEALPVLRKYFPDLGEIIRRIGSTQIRNSGTIGGNIAGGSPIGDSMPPLIALGAILSLHSKDGKREMPLEAYFISYGKQDREEGEFVAAIHIPRLEANQHFRATKISKRFDQDISAVCGAICVTLKDNVITDARISFGGVAAKPLRAPHAEKALMGADWTESTIRLAMAALEADITPISDMRASADYRLKVAQNILMRAYLEYDGEALRLVGEMA